MCTSSILNAQNSWQQWLQRSASAIPPLALKRAIWAIISGPLLPLKMKGNSLRNFDRKNLNLLGFFWGLMTFYSPHFRYRVRQKPLFGPKSGELFQFARDFLPTKNYSPSVRPYVYQTMGRLPNVLKWHEFAPKHLCDSLYNTSMIWISILAARQRSLLFSFFVFSWWLPVPCDNCPVPLHITTSLLYTLLWRDTLRMSFKMIW